jgi:hypothetical protein
MPGVPKATRNLALKLRSGLSPSGPSPVRTLPLGRLARATLAPPARIRESERPSEQEPRWDGRGEGGSRRRRCAWRDGTQSRPAGEARVTVGRGPARSRNEERQQPV